MSGVAHQRCARCGYDLRGVDPSGRCPECSLSLADAAAGLHRHAPRSWRVMFGVGLALFANFFLINAAWIVLWVFSTRVLKLSGVDGLLAYENIRWLGFGLLLGGVWLVTVWPGLEQGTGLRLAIRLTGTLAIVGSYLRRYVLTPYDGTITSAIAWLSVPVLSIVVVVLLALYIRRLARALPHPTIAKRVLYVAPIAAVLMGWGIVTLTFPYVAALFWPGDSLAAHGVFFNISTYGRPVGHALVAAALVRCSIGFRRVLRAGVASG